MHFLIVYFLYLPLKYQRLSIVWSPAVAGMDECFERVQRILGVFSLHDQDDVNHQICGQEGFLHWIMLAQFWQLCPFTATKNVLLLRSSYY